MLYQLKLIAFCWAGLGLGLIAWNFVASREAKRIVTRTHVIAVFAITAIMFIQSNIYVWFAAAALIPAIVAISTRSLAATAIVMATLTFRLTYGVRIGVYLGYYNTTTFIFLGLLAAAPFMRGKAPVPRAIAIDLAAITFVTMQVLISLHDPGYLPRTIAETALSLLVPYIVLRLAIRRPEDVHIVQTCVVFAAILLAGAAVIETLWRWPIYHTAFGNYGIDGGVSAYTKMRGGFMRIPTVFNESTSFGVFLGVVIAFAVSNPRIFLNRQRQALGIAIIIGVIIVTFSRSAIIAGLFAILMTMFYRDQIGRSLAGIGLLIAGIFGVVALADLNAGVAQFVRTGGPGEAFDYREVYWREGIKIVQTHPLTGVSNDQMLKSMASLEQSTGFVDPVNAYLALAIHGGIFAALLLFLLISIPLIVLWASRGGSPNSHERRVKAGLFGATFSLLLALAGTSFSERNPIWVLLCGAAAAGAVARPRQRVTEEAA